MVKLLQISDVFAQKQGKPRISLINPGISLEKRKPWISLEIPGFLKSTVFRENRVFSTNPGIS
jgi:hypothetical protein